MKIELPEERKLYCLIPRKKDLNDALIELCDERPQWRFTPTRVNYIRSNLLTLKAAFWNYWVKNRVFPMTHDKNISVQRLIVAYCLSRGHPFNLRRVLAGEIRRIHAKNRGPHFLIGLMQPHKTRAGDEPRPIDFVWVKGIH